MRKGAVFLKLRAAYTKTKEAKYIAHLDLTRVFDRSLRRAGIQVAYSEGFNPHPKIAFGPPLPVGVEGRREYVDIELKLDKEQENKLFMAELLELLQKQLPDGIRIIDFCILPPGSKALMAVINLAVYTCKVPLKEPVGPEFMAQACRNWLAREEAVSIRFKKGKKDVRNIRPFVKSMEIMAEKLPAGYMLELEISTGNEGSVRPLEVLESMASSEGLSLDLDGADTKRNDLFILLENGKRLTPLEYVLNPAGQE